MEIRKTFKEIDGAVLKICDFNKIIIEIYDEDIENGALNKSVLITQEHYEDKAAIPLEIEELEQYINILTEILEQIRK